MQRMFFTLDIFEQSIRVVGYVLAASFLTLALICFGLSIKTWYKKFDFWKRFECELHRRENNKKSNTYYVLMYIFMGLGLFFGTAFAHLHVTDYVPVIQVLSILSLAFITVVAFVRTEDHIIVHNIFFILVQICVTTLIILIGLQKSIAIMLVYVGYFAGFILTSILAFFLKDKYKRKTIHVIGIRFFLFVIFGVVIGLNIVGF